MSKPEGIVVASNDDHKRWVISQPPPQRPKTSVEVPTKMNALVKKYCLCSPTHHPGSFRCRLHRADYAWVENMFNSNN